MKNTGKTRLTRKDLEAMQTGDKRKLVYMSLLLGVLAIAFIVSKFNEKKYASGEEATLQASTPVEKRDSVSPVVMPNVDLSELDQVVADSTQAERARMGSEGLNLAVDYTRILTREHYRVLFNDGVDPGHASVEPRLLDSARVDELAAEPGPKRGSAYRVYGFIDDLRAQKRGAERPEEQIAVVTLEDGSRAHVLVLELPDFVTTRPFFRLDGIFLQNYRTEIDTGWIEGPLIVGYRMERAYERIADANEKPIGLLAAVQDDSASEIHPAAFEAHWALMAHANSESAAAIDWENVPELDNELLTSLLKDGEAYRGKPFRLPISRNIDTWISHPKENPTRLDAITTGWIGNVMWTAGAIEYELPQVRDDLQGSRLITGRGFFLRNRAYEPAGGGLRVAPLFVMQSLEIFHPVYNPGVDFLFLGIVGMTVIIILAFTFLLMRDKRKSAALQEALVHRRRARRDSGKIQGAPVES